MFNLFKSKDKTEYSYKEIRKMSDTEWESNRERVRVSYCQSGKNFDRAEKLQQTLNRFDDVYYERQPKSQSKPPYWTDKNRWEKD